MVGLSHGKCERMIKNYLHVSHFLSFSKFYLVCFQSDPQQVCTALGLCGSKQSNKVSAELITNSVPLKKHLLSLKPKGAILKSQPYRASPQCVLCEFVMSELKNLLNQNSTEVRSNQIHRFLTWN